MLSKNFSLKELHRSDTADRNGIDNTPGLDEIERLMYLVTHLLQPLRDLYGKPLIVNSGYRSPELNRAVEGSPTSQHMRGEAADIRPYNAADLDLLRRLVVESGLEFDQMIVYPSFIHLSLKRSGNRKQIIRK